MSFSWAPRGGEIDAGAPPQPLSDVGPIGGGRVPRPGEVSLAYHGTHLLRGEAGSRQQKIDEGDTLCLVPWPGDEGSRQRRDRVHMATARRIAFKLIRNAKHLSF
jgi:hypothetical protein